MKTICAFFFILGFLIVKSPAQSDTIQYYFDKETYFEYAFYSLSENLKSEYQNKNIRVYSIPLYCFNDSIRNYCCGQNLEPMIDFTPRHDLQTVIAIKERKEFIFYKVFFDRFYDEVERGNIKANKERYNKYNYNIKSDDAEFINQSDGNFYPFLLIKGTKKPTFFQKMKIGIKNIRISIKNVTRRQFQYGKLWKFIDKHPDAHVFQITFVPGYWAIMDEKLIRISNGKKVKISDANTYFCESYAYCAVRLVYGQDSAYTVQQEECEKQKYDWPKCNDCKKNDFQNIILINENK